MAMANFMDRAASAASRVLTNFKISAFEDRLAAQVIGVSFDGAAVQSPEGRASLDLIIRLLSRLYPTIALRPLDAKAKDHGPILEFLAKSINPEIELAKTRKAVTVSVVVGSSPSRTKCPTFFIGSDGWRAKLSSRGLVGSGKSMNPFGAGAASCFAAANVFRTVFADQLDQGDADELIDLSMLTYAQGTPDSAPGFEGTDIGETHLVGLGAIGNGAIWALARAVGLKGSLRLVDHEEVDLSNLQRYVLAGQCDVGSPKVDLARAALADTALQVSAHCAKWDVYVSDRNDWMFERVAVALDNAPDRIAVQGALPKWIVNAWTQELDLGVSRHGFDDGRACLACLYLPHGKVKDDDEKMAEELKMPEAQQEIRDLLQTNRPVDVGFVERVAKTFDIPSEALKEFVGQSVRSFHQRAICGGIVMRLTDGAQPVRAVVPMSFQSALAGIMLAADLVKHASGLLNLQTTSTRINLLRPLASHLHDPKAKDRSGRCICADEDFLAAYRRKYPSCRAR
ncbi:E2 ligase fold family C protein [Bradyrhizobium sp. sGM-13]|uniref:E2 ligase fold family C protein n=1 Tax=Bradyrhizobium sp. sGM-13 TaxID=2831781 RepID=UPI001BCF6C65|nr:E2 ligase fold family C protein [Bradyrhizobium sp. sGM-13]